MAGKTRRVSPQQLRASPIYQEILKNAVDLLAKHRCIDWELMVPAGWEVVADSILRRVNWIKEELETLTGLRLIPVSAYYFTDAQWVRDDAFDTARTNGMSSPAGQAKISRYLPIGHAKKAAGWTLADQNNDVLVTRDMMHVADKIQGARKALIDRHDNAVKHGILIPATAMSLLPVANGGQSPPV